MFSIAGFSPDYLVNSWIHLKNRAIPGWSLPPSRSPAPVHLPLSQLPCYPGKDADPDVGSFLRSCLNVSDPPPLPAVPPTALQHKHTTSPHLLDLLFATRAFTSSAFISGERKEGCLFLPLNGLISDLILDLVCSPSTGAAAAGPELMPPRM